MIARLCLVSLLSAGPLAVIDLFLTFLAKLFFSFFSLPMDEWFAELFPIKKETDFFKISERIHAGWNDYKNPGELSSFLDLFYFGNEEQKLGILDAMLKEFNPFYAPFLLNALKNPSNAIRIEAAVLIQDLRNRLEKKGQKMMEASFFERAVGYEEIAFSGIFDSLRFKEFAKLSLDAYTHCIKKDPQNMQLWLSQGRLFYSLAKYQELLTWSEEYQKRFGFFPEIAKEWVLESLYSLKNFDELERRIST